MPVKYLKKPME